MAQETVTVAMWRVNKAARFALTAMAAHRESVPGVRQIETDLVPLAAQFVTAVEAAAAHDSQRKVATDERTQHMAELHQRVLFWLTYVRLDVPGYEASDMPADSRNVDALIGRAQRMLNHLRLLPSEKPRPYYAEQLATEITPLLDRAVRERDEAEAMTLERARSHRAVRDLALPVYRKINTLRALLRNALGASHPHVRALSMDAPSRTRRSKPTTDQNVTQPVMPLPTVAADTPTAPTTAQRTAIGQA